jgi:hypothetical protein
MFGFCLKEVNSILVVVQFQSDVLLQQVWIDVVENIGKENHASPAEILVYQGKDQDGGVKKKEHQVKFLEHIGLGNESGNGRWLICNAFVFRKSQSYQVVD